MESLKQQIITLTNSKMFEDSNSFSKFIEQKAREQKCSHVDAILEYCKENYIDPNDIKSLINKSLKDKLEVNFQDDNYLPKKAKLDV
jgi:hypothetical protein